MKTFIAILLAGNLLWCKGQEKRVSKVKDQNLSAYALGYAAAKSGLA